MANNGLTKSYLAEGAITAQRIVKVGAADYGVLQGAAVGDKLIGVSTEVDAATGERIDVVHEGIADLKIGATVARGDLLTCDATGRGVTAAPSAGTNNRIVGMALVAGVVDDVIPVLLSIGSFQG